MLTTDKTNTLIRILNSIRTQVKSLNQSVNKLHNYSNQFSTETFWNRLNQQYTALKNGTETLANSVTNNPRSISMEYVQTFYQNGLKQVNKIEQICTQILIQLNQMQIHIFNMKSKQQFQTFLNSMLKDIKKIIIQFTNLGDTFVNKKPNLFGNNSASIFGTTNAQINRNSQPLLLNFQREENMNKIRKQLEEKIRRQYEGKIADFQGKIKHKDQIFIMNSNERLKEKQSQRLKIQNLERQVRNHLQTIKKLQVNTMNQRVIQVKFNEQRDRLKLNSQKYREQCQGLKRKIQLLQNDKDSIDKISMQLQSKSRQSMQQVFKLEGQTKRMRQLIDSKNKEEHKLKQAIQMKTYQLNTKTDDVQRTNTELKKLAQFIEVNVNFKLISLIQEVSKITGNDQSNLMRHSQRTNVRSQYLTNLSPTKQIQQNLLLLINQLQSLMIYLKAQIGLANNKVDSHKKQLKNYQIQISTHRNQVNNHKNQLNSQQKLLNLLHQKHSTFISYDSLLDAYKQKKKEYQQICNKLSQAKQLCEQEKSNLNQVKLQFKELVTQKFHTSSEMQELYAKIQKLTKENRKMSSELQANYQTKLTRQIQKKQIELQPLMEKLSQKQLQLQQMIHQDRTNKAQLLKLTKELQSLKKASEQQKQRHHQKITQYEFKINRFFDEKQSLLLQTSQNSIVPRNNTKSSRSQSKNVINQEQNNFFSMAKDKNTKDTPKKSKITQLQQSIHYSFGKDQKRQKLQSAKKLLSKSDNKLETLMEEKQQMQEMIYRINRQKTQIKQENHQMAVKLSATEDSQTTAKYQQKIEELECLYEQKSQLVIFYESQLQKKVTQIAKIKKSAKTK